MGFWKEEKAQVSAELIIVLAAVIAVALVLVTQLQNTAKTGSQKIDKETERVFNKIGDIGNKS